MPSKYKSPWEPLKKNEAFWREVLEGRTIKEVKFNDVGIEGVVLDNGEHVGLHLGPNNTPTIFIQDET